MRISRVLIAFALTAALIGASGCSDGETGTSAQASQTSDLPTFTSTTLDGVEFSSTELEGRPSVLWFWAPWCSTCDAESTQINAAASELGNDVEIIGVGGLGPSFDIEAFVEFNDLGTIRNLVDEEADIWTKFGVLAQPSFAFISSDGSYEIALGILDADTIVERARALE